MKFITEFKEFINRGNVMDMAVGLIIGAAFTGIVTALTTNIIDPLIKLITGGNGTDISGLTIPVPGTENGIDFGAFIGAIINFLIIAFIVFLLVKFINRVQSLGSNVNKKIIKKNGQEMEEIAPTCPYCLEEVNEGATRCAHCAAELPEKAEKTLKPVEA